MAGEIIDTPPTGKRASKVVLVLFFEVVVALFVPVEVVFWAVPVCFDVDVVPPVSLDLPPSAGAVVCCVVPLTDDEPDPEFWRATRESKSGSHLGHNGQAAVKVVRKRRTFALAPEGERERLA